MNWYCLHTKPRAEPQVAAYCREVLGLETYYPRVRELKRIQHTRRLVIGPLFPRYLFCRFRPEISYRAVRYAPEVADIVQRAGQPAIVSDGLVVELRHWAGDMLDATSLHPAWHEGDAVRITHGPLSGITGIVVRLRDDDDRVELLLQLLHEGAKTSVQRDQLELATPRVSA